MKRKIVISACCLLFLSTTVAQSQNIEVFSHKNRYGILKDGKEVVKAKYEYISPLIDNNYFLVRGDKGFYGAIDTNGKELIPVAYEALDYFSNGAFQAKKNNKWGLVNYRNYIALPFKYTRFNFVTEDIAEIWDGDKVGYISKYGTIMIPPAYESIKQFTPTTYLVSQKGKVGLISNLGDELVPISYDEITLSTDPRYYDIKKNNKLGKMDLAFKVIIQPDYDSIEPCDLGFLLKKDDKIGFYTTNGTLIKPNYTRIVFIQPEFGLAVVKENNQLGFVTSTGVIVSPRYDNLSRFSENGVSFVEKAGKLMAVNVDGKEITVQDVMNLNNQESASSALAAPSGNAYPF